MEFKDCNLGSFFRNDMMEFFANLSFINMNKYVVKGLVK